MKLQQYLLEADLIQLNRQRMELETDIDVLRMQRDEALELIHAGNPARGFARRAEIDKKLDTAIAALKEYNNRHPEVRRISQ